MIDNNRYSQFYSLGEYKNTKNKPISFTKHDKVCIK